MASRQNLYAANLIQPCGYPLHSPGPTIPRVVGEQVKELYQTEGLQIGDVGYINEEGEFRPIFNICRPLPKLLLQLGFPKHEPIDFGDPYRKPYALSRDHVFMTGVNQDVNLSSSNSAVYKFTAESSAGAVLILPDGATLLDPPHKSLLKPFREVASKHARLWCKQSGQNSLYLITGMYKTRRFTLASFNSGRPKQDMVVKAVDKRYEWKCGFTAYPNSSVVDNTCENQTVLIKGFRMTVRLNLPVVERVSQTRTPFGNWIASLWATFQSLLALHKEYTQWPSGAKRVPLSHPSDSINNYLLEMNPEATVAITHDNEWISMLEEGGLRPEDLMQEDRLRDFLEERKYPATMDPVNGVVIANSESSQPIEEVVITHMQAEHLTVGLERVPVGFYIQVDVPDWPYSRTKSKHTLVCSNTIQWDDVIQLPSDPSTKVKLVVCAFYEMLGQGESLHILEKTVGALLEETGHEHRTVNVHAPTASSTSHDNKGKGQLHCVSLLVEVKQRPRGNQAHVSNEADITGSCPAKVTEATNKGHEILRCYLEERKEEGLRGCIALFNRAKVECIEHSCRAAHLVDLAKAEFISYRDYGIPLDFERSTDHYRRALDLAQKNQDRAMMLLHLAQALSYHSSTIGSDISHEDQMSKLLYELNNICPEGTHGRRAADVVSQTHQLFALRDSDDLGKLNKLISTLSATVQDQGPHFDRAAEFNSLGAALQKRFQLRRNAADLNLAIESFHKAIQLAPTDHLEKSDYLANLSDALLVRSRQARVVPLTRK